MDTGEPRGHAAQVTIAGFGAGTAQVAEHLHSFTLADLAAGLTIAYTAWLLGERIYDRLIKPYLKRRGG